MPVELSTLLRPGLAARPGGTTYDASLPQFVGRPLDQLREHSTQKT
jgi:hypothetical protein